MSAPLPTSLPKLDEQLKVEVDLTRAVGLQEEECRFAPTPNESKKPTPETRSSTLWGLSFTCWTIVALVDVVGSRAYYVATSTVPPDWRLLLTWSCTNAYGMALLTPAIYWITQRFAFTRKYWKSAATLHIFTCPVFALTAAALTTLLNFVLPWSHAQLDGSLRAQIAGLFLGNVPRYALIVAITQAVTYYRRYHERELTTSLLAAQLAEARLSALKMQLQPHFIFNVLNAIATLSRRDPASSERMTLQLAELLRMSLQHIDVQEVPLSQELRFLECYLRLQQIRFADRLSVEVDVDPSVLDAAVPHLVLQPLVENAIRHGISARVAPGRIAVRARRQNNRLALEISDDGPGLVFDEAGHIREGVGLRNTRARLRQLHGRNFLFTCRNASEGGCHVFISIPIRNAHPAKGDSYADTGVDRG